MSWNPFRNRTNESEDTHIARVNTKVGSGAEQDRFGSHFGNAGSEAADRLKHATEYRGTGAEQDRYGAHFGELGQEAAERLKRLAAEKGTGAEQDRWDAHLSGAGDEAAERMKKLAMKKGVGAEQDRYQSHFSPIHFGMDAEAVQAAAQNMINAGAEGAAQGGIASRWASGLGYDGWRRAQAMAGKGGAGAEQVSRAAF